MTTRFDQIEKQTLDTYRKHGAAFDAQRPKRLHERGWLDRFTSLIPTGGSILDVGCGAAEPIAEHFINEGYEVTGVDFSESMLELARERFPQNEWIQCDMRALDLGSTFHGLVAWNSFFHLTQGDQRNVLERFARHVLPGGAMMITVGPEAGEVIGHVNGVEVYHASLDTDEYRSILDTFEFDVVDFVFEDERCDMQTVLLAKKRV